MWSDKVSLLTRDEALNKTHTGKVDYEREYLFIPNTIWMNTCRVYLWPHKDPAQQPAN